MEDESARALFHEDRRSLSAVEGCQGERDGQDGDGPEPPGSLEALGFSRTGSGQVAS
jgi:hypothetical protein